MQSRDLKRSECEQMFDELERLLNEQIDAARAARWEAVEQLSGRVKELSGRISDTGVLKHGAFDARRRTIGGLNQRLCVMVAAEKAQVAEQLRSVRTGKTALARYLRGASRAVPAARYDRA